MQHNYLNHSILKVGQNDDIKLTDSQDGKDKDRKSPDKRDEERRRERRRKRNEDAQSMMSKEDSKLRRVRKRKDDDSVSVSPDGKIRRRKDPADDGKSTTSNIREGGLRSKSRNERPLSRARTAMNQKGVLKTIKPASKLKSLVVDEEPKKPLIEIQRLSEKTKIDESEKKPANNKIREDSMDTRMNSNIRSRRITLQKKTSLKSDKKDT